MDRFATWREYWGPLRPALAIFGMIIILVLLSAVTIWRTATEANRIDAERTELALRNALESEAAALLAMARDNAQSDSVAAAAYSPDGADKLVTIALVNASGDGSLHDGVVAMRAGEAPLVNIRRGTTVSTTPDTWVGRGISRIIAAMPPDGRRYGLVNGSDGLRLVGISVIRPSSPDRLAAWQAAGYKPVFLILTRPFDDADAGIIGADLVLADVKLFPHQADRGQMLQRARTAVFALNDLAGRHVANIAWQPSLPGDRAIARSTPFIVLAMIAALLASILLIRRGYETVSNINRIALLDSLSELPNRRALRRMTRSALRKHRDVALAFIDLDGFKSVNDLYGHGVGDELIVQCARIIAELAPTPGGSARLGGDEFALLAFGADADQRLVAAADALLARLGDPFHIGDRTIMVGASIGLSNRQTAGDSASELMREADVAMYVAKRTGKMRWVWFDRSHDRDRNVVHAIEQQLRIALDNEAFDVVYQPMISARHGSVSGFEALVRWNRGDGSALGPDYFIPVAEDTGLIDRLGEFVVRRACFDALDWEGHSLSINVSATQLRNPHFTTRLAEILAETGFAAERLVLEITETYVVSDPGPAQRVIEGVRALGVRVALDDFGTGYASIGFLRQFAFDWLKIDRALVAEAMTDKAARTMLHSTIALARALEMTIVAEGIENEGQAVVMRAAGCDLLQGWHFARESDADTSAALVEPAAISGDEAASVTRAQ